MIRAAIFIDGGYWNKVAKTQFDSPAINFELLTRLIFSENGLEQLRSYMYDCMPVVREGNKEDEKLHSGKQRWITRLRRIPRFEVKLGKLQKIGNEFKQKRVDVLMSLDIVDMCFRKHIDHAILIAGDSDFVPAVRKAKEHGAIVHLYYHPRSVHNELLDEIDELHEIDKALIEDCRLAAT